jgi:hypothetical protein
MNAILVAVQYSDILRLTLPYNRRHFEKVLVVTDLNSYEEVLAIAEPLQVEVYATDEFYANGAVFNKWLCLERGYDILGREGWLCTMDADVAWPKHLPAGWVESLQTGKLYTPLRRMLPNIPKEIPDESAWRSYPTHRYIAEWGGYSQIFNRADPVLGSPPWYQTNWRHAGGGDSYFQMKWAPHNKIRPPWECLHIGESGTNWMGRVSRLADGSLPKDHDQHQRDMQAMYASRRQRRGYDNPTEKIL